MKGGVWPGMSLQRGKSPSSSPMFKISSSFPTSAQYHVPKESLPPVSMAQARPPALPAPAPPSTPPRSRTMFSPLCFSVFPCGEVQAVQCSAQQRAVDLGAVW